MAVAPAARVPSWRHEGNNNTRGSFLRPSPTVDLAQRHRHPGLPVILTNLIGSDLLDWGQDRSVLQAVNRDNALAINCRFVVDIVILTVPFLAAPYRQPVIVDHVERLLIWVADADSSSTLRIKDQQRPVQRVVACRYDRDVSALVMSKDVFKNPV